MIKKSLAFLLFFSCFCVHTDAQVYYSFSNSTQSQDSCVIEGELYNHIDKWEVYQTEDNLWDGIKDTANCIDFLLEENTASFSNLEINNQLDHVFCQLILTTDSDTSFLIQNYLYRFNKWVETNTASTVFKGVILNYAFYAPMEDSTLYRSLYYSSADLDQNQDLFCFASEKYQKQFLTSIVLDFEIVDASINSTSGIRYVSTEAFYNTMPVSNLSTNVYNSTTNHYQVVSNWYYNYLLVHDSLGIPSDSNIYIGSISPQPNTFQIDTIDLLIDETIGFVFQPFTDLIGGFVEEDTLRHVLNVINNGGNFCIPELVEKRFSNGEKYIYQSGNLDLQSQSSCLQFAKGSSLVVEKNSHLSYGKNGVGMLALKAGSTIDLKENATLTIDAKVVLFANHIGEDNQFYMEVGEGEKLIFTKNAAIVSNLSKDVNIRMNIFLNGGEVDLSALDDESKANINLIYPNTDETFSNSIKTYGNPTTNELIFSFKKTSTDKYTIRVINMNGAVTSSYTLQNSTLGSYLSRLDCSELPKGQYFLSIENNKTQASQPFIKK